MSWRADDETSGIARADDLPVNWGREETAVPMYIANRDSVHFGVRGLYGARA
jgi:hypothetical protein